MRTLMTDAIVVNEPQKKVSTKGREYIEFRAVNHDNNEDFWFTCIGFQSQHVNFVNNYVKKGSRIHVNGGLREKTYKTKDGEPGIDRSVVLFDIGFLRDGSKQNEGQQDGKGNETDNTPSESKPVEEKKTTSKAKEASKPKAAPKAVEDVPDDDLPF